MGTMGVYIRVDDVHYAYNFEPHGVIRILAFKCQTVMQQPMHMYIPFTRLLYIFIHMRTTSSKFYHHNRFPQHLTSI